MLRPTSIDPFIKGTYFRTLPRELILELERFRQACPYYFKVHEEVHKIALLIVHRDGGYNVITWLKTYHAEPIYRFLDIIQRLRTPISIPVLGGELVYAPNPDPGILGNLQLQDPSRDIVYFSIPHCKPLKEALLDVASRLN